MWTPRPRGRVAPWYRHRYSSPVPAAQRGMDATTAAAGSRGAFLTWMKQPIPGVKTIVGALQNRLSRPDRLSERGGDFSSGEVTIDLAE